MRKKIDIKGQRFGKLVALEIIGKNKDGRCMWECICDCGNRKTVSGTDLRSGHTKSCGCLLKKVTCERNKVMAKHNMSHSKLYRSWSCMKSRCYYENDRDYKNYRGRGIKVCAEWLNSFENFRDWAFLNGYKDGLTIDRINVNGNYEPSNCRWATAKEQGNNRRNNREIVFNGTSKTMQEWADEMGVSRELLANRIDNLGWDIERALAEPKHEKRNENV